MRMYEILYIQVNVVDLVVIKILEKYLISLMNITF